MVGYVTPNSLLTTIVNGSFCELRNCDPELLDLWIRGLLNNDFPATHIM